MLLIKAQGTLGQLLVDKVPTAVNGSIRELDLSLLFRTVELREAFEYLAHGHDVHTTIFFE